MIKRKITQKALAYLPKDTEYSNYTLEGVEDGGDCWDIIVDKGAILSIPKTGFVPLPGMLAKFYGKGFGYSVRGVIISDVVIYYRTPEEAELDHKAYCKKMDEDRARNLKKNMAKMDEAYNKLPDIFKARIDGFRKTNPNFRRDYEEYEMFCIKEAIKIAETLNDPEKVIEFSKGDYNQKLFLVPTIDEGHSGNTLGCATHLAYLYLSNPGMIAKTHGALVPLVGCEEYGCSH